ncbi:MAG: ATP-grasp domain-containing protein [Burkholderiales bacterium]|nr:ATP-grasp domain-containing protein [Burkholderiales bacterium]
MKPKFLFLFPDGWDTGALAALREEFDVVCEGFDLFKFPECANILWFDARRFVARLARRYRHAGVAAVASTNEQYGALIAATLACELGLPGSDPAAIIRAQHKYYARQHLTRALPGANPPIALMPYEFGRTVMGSPFALDQDPGLPFPFFIKPVKAAFSVLAARVDSPAALARHLTFHPWETHIIKRLVRPFADLMRDYGEFSVDPAHMLGEGVLDGAQINVDGWMDRGRIGFFGIVDAVMYPGTQAFQRFEYPTRLPPDAQAQAFAVAEQAMRAVGFDHGAFNVELFWQPATGSISIIEINPRLAAQFGDLYQKVDGTHPYRVLADLCVGRTPRWERGRGPFRAAASFVFREFDGAVKVAPDRAQIRWLSGRYPDAALQTFIKHGNSRWRETKWLGSYRYAIVNLGGTSRDDLEQRFADVCRHVSFERRTTPVRFVPGVDELRQVR